jgi:chromosome segregation protein
MRLKSIKLAGFKSFVDPTHVPFTTNMSAVVGPNGCGKSNIIDAVRWVMGESSAKNLRGESMTDVIFNGSTSRKPIGQASIELIFDNSDGNLKGEYGAFNEIAIRRKVTRDGQSTYFLNGTKCRRRDITDIFLGTGLGPRSYAIIEQGMISRLIESKPEELRVFLEEAAGISKYKERRRETENRMRRTQENLERLTDVREELERQLAHLNKQAMAAQRYSELKQEERQTKAQLYAMKWRAFDQKYQATAQKIKEKEVELEKFIQIRTHSDSQYELLREDQFTKRTAFEEVQARFYQSGTEIARIEQSLQHQKQSSQRLQREADEVTHRLQELALEITREEQQLNEVDAQLQELEPELETLQHAAEMSSEKLSEIEERMSQWQRQWENYSQRSADMRQRAEVEQSKIQGIENQIQRLDQRKGKLQQELDVLSHHMDDPELIQTLDQEIASQAELRTEKEIQYEHLQQQMTSMSEQRSQLQVQRDQLQVQLQSLQGELSSLLALQRAADTNQDKLIEDWLQRNNIETDEPLREFLNIESGWELAVETVLNERLKSIPTYEMDQASKLLVESKESFPLKLHRQNIVSNNSSILSAEASISSLFSKVGGAAAFEGCLNQVMIVDAEGDAGLAQALIARNNLTDGQSLITRDGIWLSANWIRFPGQDQQAAGYLQRKTTIEKIEDKLNIEEESQSELDNTLRELQEGIQKSSEELKIIQTDINQTTREEALLEAKRGALKAKNEQVVLRRQKMEEDLNEVDVHKEDEMTQLDMLRHNWQSALDAVQALSEEKEVLLHRRDEIRTSLDDYRVRARHDRDAIHSMQMTIQNAQNARENTQLTCKRLLQQQSLSQERATLLAEEEAMASEPLESLAEDLELKLAQQSEYEIQLVDARQTLEQVEQRSREIELTRHESEERIQILRNALEKLRMDGQALNIAAKGFQDQLAEDEWHLETVLENLPEDFTEETCEQVLEKIAQRIQRLGAINLAAIDEFTLQSERKVYLDAQHEDLMEALNTLENAIRKIDKETRAKFKETYDLVNEGLQNLFPKVFGGGNAYLALTGDDLLETGVSIMARPPGKKNATIHLLSGGEKALTAIALIFSIFQLNPAPFCMLDEVDAPLDDANVGRYARMVKEMSNQVQFIYITHNKIAMEMADQLMGVTMHEPGVSRLVSVDVEEAALLAQS